MKAQSSPITIVLVSAVFFGMVFGCSLNRNGNTVAGGSHSTWVTALAFSPDGSLLVSADGLGNMFFRDARTGALKHKINGQKSGIYTLAFAPDGQTLATGGADKTVRLWNVSSGTLEQELPPRGEEINGLAFSSDGSLLAIVNNHYSGIVDVWDLRVKQFRWSYKTTYIGALDFSPDGKMLAVGTSIVDLIDVETGKPIRYLKKNDISTLYTLAFAPDGQTLVGGTEMKKEAQVCQWNVESGELTLKESLSGQDVQINNIAVSANGVITATDGGHTLNLRKDQQGKLITDNRIRIWDAKGKLLRTLNEPMVNTAAELALSPDGALAAGGSGQIKSTGDVKVWNTQTGKLLWTAQ